MLWDNLRCMLVCCCMASGNIFYEHRGPDACQSVCDGRRWRGSLLALRISTWTPVNVLGMRACARRLAAQGVAVEQSLDSDAAGEESRPLLARGSCRDRVGRIAADRRRDASAVQAVVGAPAIVWRCLLRFPPWIATQGECPSPLLAPRLTLLGAAPPNPLEGL